jgi:hypothetical protein
MWKSVFAAPLRSRFWLVMALMISGVVRAASAPLDVENLQRTVYRGPNGTQVTIVRFADQTWTEVDPSVALSAKDALYKEVCFEAKFDTYAGATGIKLVGVDGSIVFEDKSKRRNAPELKALDNVWSCGNLQPAKNGRGQELVIFELAKLPPDGQRFENRFLVLEHSRNAQGLIELGQKIDQSVRNTKNGATIGIVEVLSQHAPGNL